MLPEIRLRPAVSEDRPLLEAIYASTREAELARTPWTDEEKNKFCQFQFHAQDTYYRANYPNSEFFVVEADGIPAGRLYLDRTPKEIRVMDISLLPPHRGNGIGTRLFEDLQKEAAASAKSLSIYVERFNPARRLYDRLGFRLKEEEGEIYLLMEWRAPEN